jgi:hypothetical protein
MEGEGERPDANGGFQESAGDKLELNLVDLLPMPAANRIEVANLPQYRTNTDVSEPFPEETKEHFYQRIFRADFEGRIEGARVINSQDIAQIESAIKPKDIIQIQKGNESTYFRVLAPGVITNGVNQGNLRDVLEEALKGGNVTIRRAPPKPPSAII